MQSCAYFTFSKDSRDDSFPGLRHCTTRVWVGPASAPRSRSVSKLDSNNPVEVGTPEGNTIFGDIGDSVIAVTIVGASLSEIMELDDKVRRRAAKRKKLKKNYFTNEILLSFCCDLTITFSSSSLICVESGACTHVITIQFARGTFTSMKVRRDDVFFPSVPMRTTRMHTCK